MEERKPGRPRLVEEKKRAIAYRFRLTKEERDKLFDTSKKTGMPVSEIFREALSDWYRKQR